MKFSIGYNQNLKDVAFLNPIGIKLINEKLPDMKIQYSIGYDIFRFEKIKFYRSVGVFVIFIHKNVNKYLELVKQIRYNLKPELKTMLYDVSIFNCITNDIYFSYIFYKPVLVI
ncbi:MAG: hypothetical protein ACMXYG_07750 [Candidatus Woesearchaeota archaeon]